MAGELNGKRFAVLATEGVEQVELVRPIEAIARRGRRGGRRLPGGG